MRRPSPASALLLLFLAIICTPSAVQLALEIKRGDSPQAFEIFRQRPVAKNLRAYERMLEEESWLVKRTRPWTQYAQFVWLHEAGEKAVLGRDGWLFYKPGLEYLTRRPELRAGKNKTDPFSAIIDFRDQLAARRIQLLVLAAPNKESVYPEELLKRESLPDRVISHETAGLLKKLRGAGVELVNLFEVFRIAKASQPGTALYLRQDSHWSPVGIDVAAQAVANRLLELRWIVPGATHFSGRTIELKRTGDLIRMLQSEPLERALVPENILCSQVLSAESGLVYGDQSDADLLVIGDSFLRIFQADEPGGAGFTSHLAEKLGQPVASLISDGGASTLVRQELFRRPALLTNKKVVIWEFVERDIGFGAEGWQIIPLPPPQAD